MYVDLAYSQEYTISLQELTIVCIPFIYEFKIGQKINVYEIDLVMITNINITVTVTQTLHLTSAPGGMYKRM